MLESHLGALDKTVYSQADIIANTVSDADAFNQLGNALNRQGRPEAAEIAFRRALALDPDHAGAYHNLGNTLSHQGKLEEAVWAYQQALLFAPDNATAKHMVAALTGQTTESAPRCFIRKLYDQYAQNFDWHITAKLGYDVPRVLRQAATEAWQEGGQQFGNVVDLGCGTGLAGQEFRPLASRLTGIDISPEMVEKAREKKVYDVLLVGDMEEFLQTSRENFDLFIATDVFIYIGDLSPIFREVRNRSASKAYFIFSTESWAGHNFSLRPTGRFAHSRHYIETLARCYGFCLEFCKPAKIRKERGDWIMGELFMLRCVA